jgi:type III secretion system FlhB-like substrate exporter
MNYPFAQTYPSDAPLTTVTETSETMLAEQILAKILEKGTPMYVDNDLMREITSMVVLQSVPPELSNAAAEILKFIYLTDTNSELAIA